MVKQTASPAEIAEIIVEMRSGVPNKLKVDKNLIAARKGLEEREWRQTLNQIDEGDYDVSPSINRHYFTDKS